ncbi:hypothetical protein [Lacrimispora celerecrescens]|uniref:Uncharacterized protein n=1 Tax=[Clostridium] celerecrescens 18A TaxID=1286362 RepID=A0A2M8Z5F0_9FIRM|nr:hypothetical protein [Lacrimispora celerecrescens]PJJ28676.1 hypothetical protein H171_2193 [[Clostridium] celerecrescens 18A]
MKKAIVLLLVAFMLAASLTSCRTSARKHIRPLFYQVSGSVKV